MKLDARSEIAVNFILGEGKSASESLSILAQICGKWKMTSEESFPVAMELIGRMGISRLDAIQALYGGIAMQDAYIKQRN